MKYHSGPPLEWDREPWILVRTRYSSDFVSDFKDYIPVRAWIGEKKMWACPAKYRHLLEQLIKIHFPDVDPGLGDPVPLGREAETPKSKPAAWARRGADNYLDLGLTQDCPDCVIKAAYKALAFELHPDRNNGDSTQFLRIKAAYDSICAERGLNEPV